ncbi:MAG: bifunctional proline dehydrogenase/L-glutamate gamma-semialdehyde dehydrogenase PutA [Pseudomonadales bacterium]|nr:bifunctional proline dehydrogenase/L-glutamate gamma-semialdehyde dehydrogenase PutA [Pseudomonadales bacterium]
MVAISFAEFTRDAKFASEQEVLRALVAVADLSEAELGNISAKAADFVQRIRSDKAPTLMEHFLTEYGLSTREGVALMCLAEAMLRVPDTETMDALIEDKIAPSNWGKHLGSTSSSLVNASTWALMLTGSVLEEKQPGMAGVLRGAIKRLGEPVIRVAVNQVMKEMGRQFVLGETIDKALERAREWETRGFTYSYDMLGEAAITAADADRYRRAYSDAITTIASTCNKQTVEENPGISITLSALHPRYEMAQEHRVMAELVPVTLGLARQARQAGMGFNIDAEEQNRLVLSLKVIAAVLSSPDLAGWSGFGVVVQAYGKRAGLVIDWLYGVAEKLDRRIMVRLVKGAYWDTEMKLAQTEGLPDFPLFTSKTATDVSFIANAKKLLDYSDRIYPQFATHNAHSVAAVLAMAAGRPFEFQRLHGMGERLHDVVMEETSGRCRIYAPVGAHKDLLAYLVRRLLENGANSSFVNQIVNTDISPEVIAEDPFAKLALARPPKALLAPNALFDDRINSQGFDLTDEETLNDLYAERNLTLPDATPLTVSPATGTAVPVINPASGEIIAQAIEADAKTVAQAIADAQSWQIPVSERAAILRKAADLYEENRGLIFAALAREAGKTLADCVSEVREAIDFLRYYARQAEQSSTEPQGLFAAISPWNFPLAIFTGQIAAALAVGNGVLAKPAEQTPVISAIAVNLLHEAGVPRSALQLLPGQGDSVGATLTSDPRISGVVFTGSTDTALIIRRSIADHLCPGTPFIAETGGLNAMIIDSTALPEQAVQDVVSSAFQSAGQRCSALRCLYIQEDIATDIIDMIKGAMDQLSVGDPWKYSTDVGPVIDGDAKSEIEAYISEAKSHDKVLHSLRAKDGGNFVPPTLIQVAGIEELQREVFGPVLHVATFGRDEIPQIIEAVNRKGFGLTFGLHTRIDSRVQEISDGIHVGNIYVNRNQIGAVVGSQPFGGEGMSGTGPKAGGPLYLRRFCKLAPAAPAGIWGVSCDVKALQQRLNNEQKENQLSHLELPGPTGEANTLRVLQRGPILCMGPGSETMQQQIEIVEQLGGIAIGSNGTLQPEALASLKNVHGVVWWGEDSRTYAQALAQRTGPIIPLITETPDLGHVAHERHLCIDTTAAGGNAKLLAG